MILYLGRSLWGITKITNNGTTFTQTNKIEVSSPSKIKFYENGLGFIERPTNVYCESSDLLITHDSGKTFEIINLPEGVFSLSNPNRRKLEKLL